jgi:hypothetical protein
MNAAGRQAQCRKTGNIGMPSADVGTVSSLPEGKTISAMENVCLKNVFSFGQKMFSKFCGHLLI